MTEREEELLSHYKQFRKGLRDMLDNGRLTQDLIPDDYHWLILRLCEADDLQREIDEALEAGQ